MRASTRVGGRTAETPTPIVERYVGETDADRLNDDGGVVRCRSEPTELTP
ncbi:hypothetical protein [Haloprofundus salilacus]|nr:hypothetical protein [Haloprofundus salilacus]